MKNKILFILLYLFAFYATAQIPIKRETCKTCGNALSQCQYKGIHPKCKTCGNLIEKCEYKGNHPKPAGKCPTCGKSLNQCPYKGSHMISYQAFQVAMTCNVPFAQLYVDGIYGGSIDGSTHRLTAGKHNITLVSKGYEEYHQEIHVGETSKEFIFNMKETQSDNPRGIYKLTRLTDEYGNGAEKWEDLDQYQICTDSISVILAINGTQLYWWDHTWGDYPTRVLNYTGKKVGNTDKKVQVFESSSRKFTLKWWSQEQTANGFAKDAWYIENYVADRYSDKGKALFEAISAPNVYDPIHPLYGTWVECGTFRSLQEAEQCPTPTMNLAQAFSSSNRLMICTSNHLIFSKLMIPIQTNGTDRIDNDRIFVIQGNRMIIEAIRDQGTTYYAYHRANSPQSVLSSILSYFKNK